MRLSSLAAGEAQACFVNAACFVFLLFLMSEYEGSLTGFVRDQCLNILRGFNADMDWVEGANFLGTSDILQLRVAASTFSRHWPIATFRRSFRAEWLVHYFVIFGQESGAAPVSMFLTDPDVTALAQTSGLVRLLLQPHKAITREPH